MCHGKWVPDMDFHGGYSIIRALGELPSGEMISQPALTAIHWVHRNFAFVVFAYLGVLAWRLRADHGLRGPATLMLALLGAQLLTGLTTIFFQWPLLIAVLHLSLIHIFGVKQDAIPGFLRDAWFRAEKPGIYRGQCADCLLYTSRCV